MWKKAGGEMRNILRLKCELTTVKCRRLVRQTSLAPVYCRIKAFKQQKGTIGFYPFIHLSFSCKHLQPAGECLTRQRRSSKLATHCGI